MITKNEHLKNSRVRLTLSATAAEFNNAFEEEADTIAKEIKLQGFRPGKAPRAQIIAQLGRQRIEAGALDRVVSNVYFNDMKSTGLVPVEGAKVDIKTFVAPSEDDLSETIAVTFTAEVDVVPEVKIDGYKKLRIKKKEAALPEDKEVERVIDYLRKQKATIEPAGEEATAQKDMWADIGYTGTVGGVSREDMKNEHHPIVIGEGQLIPGFEDHLVGMKVLEVKTFKVKFPKDYHAAALAGKDAEFTVTLHELKNLLMPELNDEFAIGFGHDTAAELKGAIRANIQDEKKEQSQREQEEATLDALLKVAKFEVPQVLVDQELERLFEESKKRLEDMKFQWDTYLAQTGKTVEKLHEEMRPQAEKNVRIGLALGKVIEEEGIASGEQAAHEAVHRLVEIATSK